MLTSEEKGLVDKGIRTAWVIWLGMIVSLCCYVLLVNLLGEVFVTRGGLRIPLDLIRGILIVFSAGELIVAHCVRSNRLKGKSPPWAKGRLYPPHLWLAMYMPSLSPSPLPRPSGYTVLYYFYWVMLLFSFTPLSGPQQLRSYSFAPRGGR